MPDVNVYTFAMQRETKTGFCSCKTCIHHIPVAKAGFELPGYYPVKWVANCKSVGAGDKALTYLGRYLYRGVIQEKDIVACQNGEVTYRFQNSALA